MGDIEHAQMKNGKKSFRKRRGRFDASRPMSGLYTCAYSVVVQFVWDWSVSRPSSFAIVVEKKNIFEFDTPRSPPELFVTAAAIRV